MMKLNVTNPDGSVEVVEVTADTTGQQIKEKCSVVIKQNETVRQTVAAAKAVDEGKTRISWEFPILSLRGYALCIGVSA